jgi:hypothetical protein
MPLFPLFSFLCAVAIFFAPPMHPPPTLSCGCRSYGLHGAEEKGGQSKSENDDNDINQGTNHPWTTAKMILQSIAL